ncbi:hypothetical protein GCM10010844_32140 [Deinococcus radiotolerans]|uniref:Lipoprotein n=2 Tax=Deinococcus radiotolerans TaxID=1309407 RepID=A0ABQ2FNB9_9DEIO|nr:hypothetical protein GCM10010844_32140 [Deinococcus radiotolerans]
MGLSLPMSRVCTLVPPTLVLALISSALACPAKPGTMFNGLLPAILAFKPECGAAYATFKKSAAGAKWTEVYVLRPPNDGDALIRTTLSRLPQVGFRPLGTKPYGQTTAYVFRKGTSDLVVLTKRYTWGVVFTVAGR